MGITTFVEMEFSPGVHAKLSPDFANTFITSHRVILFLEQHGCHDEKSR